MKRTFPASEPISSTVGAIRSTAPADPIAEFRAGTDRQQVDLLGHSLGTSVSQSHPVSPARATDATRDTRVDDPDADALPSGVSTPALRAGPAREAQGETVGAIDTTIREQERVVATISPRSFVEIHRIFTGTEPATDAIVRSFSPWIPAPNLRNTLSFEGWVSIQMNDYG